MLTIDSIELAHVTPDFGRWAELLDLIRRSFSYMDGVIDPPSSVHRLTEAGLRDKCGKETGIVAMDAGCIVGCIFLAEHLDRLYIGKLAVDPGFEGRGIGRQLLRRAEEIAIERGKPLLELQTRVELTGNHAAFARLGFVEVERTTHAGYSRPTSITMRKALA